MAIITIKPGSIKQINSQVKRAAVSKKIRPVFKKGMPLLLKQQAEILKQSFASSTEFQELGGRLLGQFGFTPQEVSNLDRILTLLVPGDNEITFNIVKIGNTLEAILQWVDFQKLKTHSFAQHALTKLDAQGNVIDITDVVSWVEWLENGVSIAGYQFFRPAGRFSKFSRSGEGLMREKAGTFVLKPTRVFERTGRGAKKNFLKKGFGLLVKTLAK